MNEAARFNIEHVIQSALKQHPNSTSIELARASGESVERTSRALWSLWKNNLIFRTPTENGGPCEFRYTAKTDAPTISASPRRLVHRRRKNSPANAAARILVMVEYGENRCVDLTMDEARAIYQQLAGVFK